MTSTDRRTFSRYLGAPLVYFAAGCKARSGGAVALADTPPPADEPGAEHQNFMRLAIEQAKLAGKYPFGAVIIDGPSGAILAKGFNQSADDPTAHGEMVALRAAAAVRPKIRWRDAVLYTNAEPCAMCQAAIEWAGLKAVYYGTSIPFLQALGTRQIDIRAADVAKNTPFRQTLVVGGVLEAECNELFRAP